MANELYLFATKPNPNDIGLRSGAAGGAVNVTALVGALIFAGFAPTVQTPRNIAAGTGVMTVTGYAPTVQTPRNITAGTGVLTITGFAPTVQTPRNIVPSTGVLSFTGIAPTVQTPVSVTPLTGALDLVGFVPTVVAGGGTPIPVEVFPATGALAFDAYAPVVVVTDRSVGGSAARRGKKKHETDVNTKHAELWAAAAELNPILPAPDPRLVYGGEFGEYEVAALQQATFQPDSTPDTAQRLSPQLAALFALALDEMDE